MKNFLGKLLAFLGKSAWNTAQGIVDTAVGFAAASLVAIWFRSPLQQLNKEIPTELLNLSDIQETYKRGILNYYDAMEELSRYGYNVDKQNMLLKLTENLLSSSDYLSAYWRGHLNDEELTKKLNALGILDNELWLLKQISRSLMNVGDVQSLFVRGEITDAQASKYFETMGFDVNDQAQLLKLAYYIPTVPDFVRFAVREVFTPEIAQLYGQFEDYPEQFEEYAKKAGLDPTYAKYYWAAHWDLPSATQGYEMLHRGLIDENELAKLLRSLDYMPYWRDKLIALNFNPYTRVDTRRMYKAGVLSYEDVIKTYRDLGYDQEHATKLADWTVKDAVTDDKELSKAETLAAYNDSLITREECFEALSSLGYSPENAELLIAIAENKKIRTYVNTYVTAIKREFLNYRIDQITASAMLQEAQVPTEGIEELINAWTLEQNPKVTLPTKAEITKWYFSGYLSEEDARGLLSQLGYADHFIDLYLMAES